VSSIGSYYATHVQRPRKALSRGESSPELAVPKDGLKTLFSTTAGASVDTARDVEWVGSATRTPSLLDVIRSVPTNKAAIEYMEETTYTNTAAETAEGSASPEATLAFTPRTSPVRKITVWIPVTDEQLEDDEQVREVLDDRLTLMVRQRLESQIINGDGVAPNLTGILNTAGIQTQAQVGGESVNMGVRRAMAKVRTPGEAVPSAIVIAPADALDEDLNVGTASPTVPYVFDGKVWNVPRYESTALTAGTALVGDFSHCVVRPRRLTISLSNSHGTYFVENKQALKCVLRAAFVVQRPAAFVTLTGI